jgi:O-antigen/teichoic acid export membrane protein
MVRMQQPLMPTMLQASGAALMSRVLLVLAGLGSSILLPLVLDQTAVGQFFMAQILIAGLSTVALFGLSPSIPAAVTSAVASGDLGRARQSVIQIGAISIVAAVVTSVLAFTVLPPVIDRLGIEHAADWLLVLPVVVAIVPFTSQTTILTELLRATHGYKAAANLSALAGSFTVLYLVLAMLTGCGATVRNVLLAGLAGSALCTCVGSALLFRQMRKWPRTAQAPASLGATVWHTLPNLLSTLVLFALSQFDILLLSAWSGAQEVAIYGIAIRFSNLLILPLAIANAALAPIAVELRTRCRLQDLQRILRQVALTCAALAVLPYLGVVVFGPWLISVWNVNYVASYWLMLILGLGQILHASCGAAGMLLMTGGDQLAAMRITLATGLVTVVLCPLGLHFAGSLGLALAAALGNVLQVAGFCWRVRLRFALEPSLWAFLRPATVLGDVK